MDIATRFKAGPSILPDGIRRRNSGSTAQRARLDAMQVDVPPLSAIAHGTASPAAHRLQCEVVSRDG